MLHITGDCYLPAGLLLPHTVRSTYYLSFLCCVWVTSMKGIDRSLSRQDMSISLADTLLPSWSVWHLWPCSSLIPPVPHTPSYKAPQACYLKKGQVWDVCTNQAFLYSAQTWEKWGQWRELEGSAWSHCSSAGLLSVLTRPVPTGKLH